MTKEYITITILNIKELNIDDSSKADLCCYLYCTSWGKNPQQTDVFKNTLSANFSKAFQIPINDFKTDVVTFKLKDLSKNKVLSSVSIQASRIPPGDGFKVLNLIPESNVKNGGKLEIEFQGKDEEYSDTTEPLIPPILPLSEDSEPSFDNLEKIYKKNHKEPSILTFHPEPETKPNDEYSNYSYDSNSNMKHPKKSENQNNEYSYYSTESLKNQKNHQSSIPKADNQNINDEYSYYSTNSHQNQEKAKQQNDELSYEYYSTDPPDPPKPQLNNSSFCDSYNYESSTESPIKPSKSSENLSQASNLSQNSSQNLNDENNSVQKDVSLNNETSKEKKSTDTKNKSRKSSKENKNPNKSQNKEPKKVKNAAFVKREKAAPITIAAKKMIKKVDAAIFSKYFKEKSRNLH